MTSTTRQAALGELYIASNAARVDQGQVASDVPELAIAGGRKEIVFIDASVPDMTTLIGAIGADKEVVILDPARDGLQQIVDALVGRSSIDALHVISHGAAGAVGLGTLLLEASTLDAHQDALQAIGRSLTADGDIMLYGCDIGAGSAGQVFIDRLAIATGADVAASSNLTGNAGLGGDWQLEVTSGAIDIRAAVDPSLAALYRHTLAIPSSHVGFDRDYFDNDGGKGDASLDVVYRVEGDPTYLLKIDGATKNVANYDAGYIASDSLDGDGETELTFSFVGGQVFTPVSIDVANFQYQNTSQYLVFKAYNAAGTLVGTRYGVTSSGVDDYTTVSLSGLTGIATLKLSGDPQANGGKLFYLTFDNLFLRNIEHAAPGPAVPKVTSVSSDNPNALYTAGATILVKVTFDQLVTVDTTGGTPTLQLETGTVDASAAYVSGSGSNTLVFQYTVLAGHNSADLEYAGTGALALNGATIKLAGGTADAALALPAPGANSLAANKQIVIDALAPAAPSQPVLDAGDDSGILGDDRTSWSQPAITGTAEANATVTLYDGAREIGSTTAGAGGAWSVTPTRPLEEGLRSLTAKATDAAGNVSPASPALALTIDFTPPTIAITSDKFSLGAGATATITFTFSEDPGASFIRGSVTVEGGELGPIGGSGTTRSAVFTPTPGFVGHPKISVGAGAYTDLAGNNGGSAAMPSIYVDTVAPAAPAAPLLDAGSDSGRSSIDKLTKVTLPTFRGGPGSAEAGATVRVYDGVTLITTATVLGDGSWSARSAIALSEGERSITATVVDLAGNVSPASASNKVTIDTTAPGAPTKPDLVADSDTGSVDDDDITGDTTPTFSGTAQAGATVTLYQGSTVLGSTIANGSGQWQITSAVVLGQGSHAITAVATDAAGNEGPSSQPLTITVITDAPTNKASSLGFSEDSGAYRTDLVTNVAVQTISGTLDADLASGEYVEVSIAVGAWQVANVDGRAWDLSTTLASGTGTVAVRVVNAIGNSGAEYSREYTLDTLAPGVTISSNLPSLKAGETAVITFSFSEDPHDSFEWDGSAGDLVVEGGMLSALSGTGSVRTATFTPDADDNDGSASITVAAGSYRDLAGNLGMAGATPSLSFDTLAPGAPSTPAMSPGSDTGIVGDRITVNQRPTFTGSAEAGATVFLLDAAGNRIGSGVAVGGVWSIAPHAALPDGLHAIRAVAYDAAGNASAASKALALTIDTIAPTVSISSNAASLKAGQQATITFTFSEDPGNSFTLDDVQLKDATLDTLSGSGLVRTAILTPRAGVDNGIAAISIGSNSYFDTAGNPGGSAFTTVRYDTLAPAAPSRPDLDADSDTGASSSDDITADTTPTFSSSAEDGATVILYAGASEIGSAVAIDGKWQITSTSLDAGTHAITAVAIDSSGNRGLASAALDVHIAGGAPATKVTGLSFSADTGAAGNDLVTRIAAQELKGTLDAGLATGEFVEVSVNGGAWQTASVDGTEWRLSATLDAGSHPIAVRVTNAIGASGAEYARDYTLDTIAPGVTIASNVASVKSGESATITFTFSEDPGASFSWDGAAGDLSVKGGTLSALTGTGLTRSATFTPDANVDKGSAHIVIASGAYADLAGNPGLAGAMPMLHVDTLAPGAPAAPALAQGSDTGVSGTDNLTANARPTFTGSAESGATVTLYDGKGNALGSGVAVDGAWSIAPGAALDDGLHAIHATVRDAAGNVGAAGAALEVRIDTGAPTLAIASSVAQLKIGGTAIITFTFSEDPGSTFTLEDVQVKGGALGELSGAGLVRSAVFTPSAGIDDGVAVITVAGNYTDAAGNVGGAGTAPALRFDTLAPAAPSAPLLDPASDTGASDSDGITSDTTPTFGGSAPDGLTIRLYDGAVEIGTAPVVDGKWSITSSALGLGAHSITAVAVDGAGNLSAPSQAVSLTVEAPPSPPSEPGPTLVDGMPVQSGTVSLPGGVSGTTISVPIVTTGRTETDGAASVADIPLAAGNGATSLLAQLPAGYGLSSSGASVGTAGGLALLIASIRAATPNHAASDQGHLVANGTSFLQGLQYDSLLVQTVAPVSTPDARGPLVLTGFNPSGSQGMALVIDSAGLANGSRLEIVNADFAAVIGQATVLTRGKDIILAGDGASQHFTVGANGSNEIYAGGGSDLLSFGLPPDAGSAAGRSSARVMPGEGASILHGGQQADTAAFTGARADYEVAAHNGYLVVASRAAPNARALVVNVEQLRFSDGVVAVENGDGLSTLAGMYRNVLGRQADLGGFEFWADRHDEGVSWGAIALAMIGSNERLAGHAGFTGDAASDVALLYRALFDREADAGGMAHWLNVMRGGMRLEQVAGHFVESAEMVGHQRAATEWDFFV